MNNKKVLAPVVLFVYNRPVHTLKVLEALCENELASESDLYIFCDGPKENADAGELEKIKSVHNVVEQKKWCRNVTIYKNNKNKGLATSVIDGVSKIVNEYGRVIVLEDDLVTSPYFLRFMNDALNMYELNDDVACVSGYMYPVKGELPETFFIKVADCWGWATWKSSWNIFEKDGSKLLHEIESRGLNSEFDFDNSYNFTQMLSEQIAGKNSSWAIRWYASVFLKNKYCLYPGVSVVQNIGIDGSGTHSGKSDKWTVSLSQVKINVKKITIEENAQAKKLIINYFQKLKQSNHSFLKRTIARVRSILKTNIRK